MSIENVEGFVFWSMTVATLVVLLSMAAVVAITVSLAREGSGSTTAAPDPAGTLSDAPRDTQADVKRAA